MSEGLVMMMFGRLHVSMEPLDGTTHGDG
jgi:hypothetical protein